MQSVTQFVIDVLGEILALLAALHIMASHEFVVAKEELHIAKYTQEPHNPFPVG